MKVVNVEQMLDLERRSADIGAPPHILMENAGLKVAQAAADSLGEVTGRCVVLLIGPGNNGGDGLVAARHLHDWGASIHLFLFKRNTENDKNFDLDVERNIPWKDISSDDDLPVLSELLDIADMVVDALFGTGKTRPFEGVIKQMIEQVKAQKELRPEMKILAIDLPSGLNADTGGVDPACLPADLTVTLGYPKVGLYQFPGAALLGRLQIAEIGISARLAAEIKTELITADAVRSLLPSRPLDANKGTFGRLLVVAGSINYIGAAYLVCEAAMRVGVGLVTLAIPKSLQPIVAAKLTEGTYLPLPEGQEGIIGPDALPFVQERLVDYEGLLLGCGIGQAPETVKFVEELLLSDDLRIPAIIDADGLNILARLSNWQQRLKVPAVLTPHPGEMSRLIGQSVSTIQQDRLATALQGASNWGQTVVLKGAHTVIASLQGDARISGVANPGLASAGTGDVLAGAIGGMLVQGLSPFEASICGVYLHAEAGEMVKAGSGDAGMLASDLLSKLPLAIDGLKRQSV